MPRIRYLDLVLFHEGRIVSRAALLERHASALGYLPHLPEHYAPVAMQSAAFEEDFAWRNVAFKVRQGSNAALAVPVRMFREIARLRPHIVLVHSFIHAWQILFLKRFLPPGTKLLVQNHAEQPFPGLKSSFQRWAARSVDAFLFVSADQARVWRRAKILSDRQPVFEVMEGSTPFTVQSRAKCRARLGLGAETVFLWVGRLDSNKDPMTILQAFRQLKPTAGRFKLYLAFNASELAAQVAAFVATYGLSEQIVLLGTVAHADLETWYNAADFFVLGSHHEGSGYALCEALACGCTPIVTNIPSFRKMTGDGTVGRLFEPGNDQQLAGHLRQAMSGATPPVRQSARRRFEEKLSHAAIARDIDAACRQLLGK